MTKRYKDTIFLPQSSFPMKGDLPQREPVLLAQWAESNLYVRVRQSSHGRNLKVVHVGPPYANGHLHMGHALSHILKDITARFYQMRGFDAPLVPGWDCHGLPIEWKVEEEYRAAGRTKETISTREFRERCRSFAAHWVQEQSKEFQRLGILSDWKNPYATYDFATQASVIDVLGHFLRDGSLYRGVKPVMWSAVEKTALAEAEIEYHDRRSIAIDVAFPIHHSPLAALDGAHVVIWTTTPWSLPSNRAIAYGKDMTYNVVQTPDGQRYVVAQNLKDACATRWGLALTTLYTFRATDLQGTVCYHPWYGQGYDFDVPLLPGDHVTAEDGTGFVHTAPEHGVEDFVVAQKHSIPVPSTVDEKGCYHAHVPLWAGLSVFKVHPQMIASLHTAGKLLSQAEIVHSYPHSWRSKAPLIYRTTPQWFISLDRTGLRDKALKAMDDVQWTPSQGYNRLRGMLEKRPDWCISRQRVWGVPLAIFVHKTTGEPLRDPEVHQRIVEAVRAQGSDFWFEENIKGFLGPNHDPDAYEPVYDILDVWFDSGCSHQYVCQARPELTYPADLYLEGSDQHRGWFQSSLLTSVALTGHAPYRHVVTHGFLLDQTGHKLSKSKGNGLSLEEVINKHGADVIRLWVVGADYTHDLAFGPDILKQQDDIYRRLRNTLRYLLGVLTPQITIPEIAYQELPFLERWVLHRVFEVQTLIEDQLISFNYNAILQAVHHFCTQDLSSLYFDIRKDALYCGASTDPERQSALYVMNILFDHVVRWLAPIISFTAEEAWQTRYGPQTSAHTQKFIPCPSLWHQPPIADDMSTLRDIRGVVTHGLEQARASKIFGSSLEAHVDLDIPQSSWQAAQRLSPQGWADFLIVSSCTIQLLSDVFVPGHMSASANSITAPGAKCERCWKYSTSVQEPDVLCARCQHVVATYHT